MIGHLKNIRLLFPLILCILSCEPIKHNNIYKKVCKKGEQLSWDVFSKCDQVYFTDNDLVILYNISDDAIRYDSHVMIYGNSLQLLGACYFPSQYIDSINTAGIHGELNENRIDKENAFINDLPPEYKLNLSKHYQNGIYKGDEIKVDSLNWHNKKLLLAKVSFKTDTSITLPIKQIKFDKRYDDRIFFYEKRKQNLFEYTLLINPQLLTDFKRDIYDFLLMKNDKL